MTEQRHLFDHTTTVVKPRKKDVLFRSGDSLRDKGMERSVDHAEQEEPGWADQALECIRNYPGYRFMAEDIRAWAYRNGLSEPPSCRAWGSVISKAKREGIIKHDGYKSVSNPRAHSTPASVWVKV